MRLCYKCILMCRDRSSVERRSWYYFRHGVYKSSGKTLVKVDPQYFRPAEVELLIGNPAKAKEELGWEAKITLEQMTAEMVESDLAALKG